MDPYDAWEPWRLPDVVLSGGPDTTLCEDPPEHLPVARPVGFTAAL